MIQNKPDKIGWVHSVFQNKPVKTGWVHSQFIDIEIMTYKNYL